MDTSAFGSDAKASGSSQNVVFGFGCCCSSSSRRGLKVASPNALAFATSVLTTMLSNKMPLDIVQMSMPTESILGRTLGVSSTKKSGFGICRGRHTPLYSGLSILGACHLPLYSGLSILGCSHFPQPTVHAGLAIIGASHSPSSSSSQSSGFSDFGSGICSGSSSSQPAGLDSFGSGISMGASSSQSSGFDAFGSSILASSTQSPGFLSAGSSISFGGFTGGSIDVSRLPDAFVSPSTNISTELSGLTTSPYKCERLSCGTDGGSLKCFSSHFPVFGFLCWRMKWTLLVPPHLSGPNITTYRVSSWKPAGAALLSKSFKYAPPHVKPSWNLTSYCKTNGTSGAPAKAGMAANAP
mmetsp:Transcript_18460/g.55111  ORF Transcript_18460/g.55111 Transcript_18460/m.55111 type:complete len:354 (+) Transcript_18460:364-1425(+)